MRIQFVQDTIDKIRGKNNCKTMKKNIESLYYVISMLKQYDIRNIVASPGTQNATFNYLAQTDDFFNCISVIDERSAAYVATGLSFETQEPVVITCTGATASRNYYSAMTEAYYRQIPLIALTFFDPYSNKHALSAQYLDRDVLANDIKAVSVNLPDTIIERNVAECVVKLNVAIMTAKFLKRPVHINCPSFLDFEDIQNYSHIKEQKVEYHNELFNKDFIKDILHDSRIAIFIGSFAKMDTKTQEAISNFAECWKAAVFCDHTSNYHGKNKVLFSRALSMQTLKGQADIVIDIGNVTGDYNASKLMQNSTIWRVSSGDKISFRYSLRAKRYFNCSEAFFFTNLTSQKESNNVDYFSIIQESLNKLHYPELPLSNLLVSQNLSTYLPSNCSLNVSILNSLRSMDYFNIDESIDFNCNVGGFGIDGAMSSLIGMSLANPSKLYFGLIGDLAFFYDMNILGNRHINNNLRIIIINNNSGEEFHLNPDIETTIGTDAANTLIAAGGHNKSGVKPWALANDFNYITASTKEEFLNQIQDFCQKDYDKSVIFEVFTKNSDEIKALDLIRNFNKK